MTATDTTAPTITVTRRGSGRAYAINGRPVPGVTTILDQGYPKPALVGWAANETARYAVEHLDEIRDLGPVKAYETLAKARYGVNNAAKVRGTKVHELAERIAHGDEVDVPPPLVGYVEAAIRFLDDFDVTPLRTETTVANETAGYCGTFDLYAKTSRGTMLLDWKTSKGPPYPEAALQLAAYRHAEWWYDPHSDPGELVAVTRPEPIDEAAIVWLTPERYEVFPVDTSPQVFRQFLYVAEVAKITQAGRERYIGDPL